MFTSKVMKMSDYGELTDELQTVERITQLCGGWQPEQHTHRRWEYALQEKVFLDWAEKYEGDCKLIADVGGGIGLTTPMMLDHGCDVIMYEPWCYGDWSARFWSQVSK